MMNKIVLFDFDGTIVQSYRELFRRYRTVEEFTREKEISVLGPSLEEKIKEFFPDYNPVELQEEYRIFQQEHLKETIQPMPNALELLQWLKEKQYETGIVTARKRKSLIHILELFHMVSYFDILVGYDDVKKKKPDPEGIFKATQQKSYSTIYYVGDSSMDILAGKNANVITVAYLNLEEKIPVLKELHADYYVNDLIEIKEIIEKKGV